MSHYQGQSYLRQLMYKATEYISGSTSSGNDEVEFFYRCKSNAYFGEVKRNNNVMVPIMKDFNGDPKSPINGKIKGVFLGVDLRFGALPEASPFGDMRVAFPIEAIFTKGTNLYFTDFYCSVSNYHYVTLVLAKAGSVVDDFCFSNLLQLDPFNKPFFWRSGIRFKVVKENWLHVEVFYTENIYLDNIASRFGSNKVFFKSIRILGKGSSTWGGLKKNSYCSKCNLESNSQTSSSLFENSQPVSIGQNLSAPLLKVRSHREPDIPMSNIKAGNLMHSSESESMQKERGHYPWRRWFKKWRIWVVFALFCAALFCAALYLSTM